MRGFLRRVLLSAVGSAALCGMAACGMMVTTQSQAVALILEPFSLFFLPGMMVAMAWKMTEGHLETQAQLIADNHDFSSSFVFACTLGFYFLLFYWWMHRRHRAAALTARPTSA